jgi:uncharacterized heparinase superfamily protein
MLQTYGPFVADTGAGGRGGPPDEDRLRLTRDGGSLGPSLAERLAEHLDRLRFASPLHRARLKGRFPPKLLAVPQDPVAGDPHAGRDVQRGVLRAGGAELGGLVAPLDDPTLPDALTRKLHGWEWLRDAAAVAPPGAPEHKPVENLARRWLRHFHHYHAVAWAPGATGQRIMIAIAHAPLLMPGHDHIHRSTVLNGIARWARHLDHCAPRLRPGIAALEAAAGLLTAGLMLPDGEERRARAEALLHKLLAALLHGDGAAVTRSPADLGRIGDLLLFVQAGHAARGERAPRFITQTLDAVGANLGGLSMGDGRPGPWHGGMADPAAVRRLARTGPGAAPGRLSGYRRMAAGDTVLVVDAGPPPPARLTDHGHASTLALLLSDGTDMLICSCGAARPEAAPLPAVLAEGVRSTAGHSTLTLADTNSSPLAAGGPRRLGGVAEVVVNCRSAAEGQWLEASHDGYRRRYGFDHVRRLYLAPDGHDLRGEDRLVAAGPRRRRPSAVPATVRFHLGPGWTARLAADGESADIVWSDAAGAAHTKRRWLFRARFSGAGRVAVEPSLMLDADGAPQEIEQLVLMMDAVPGAGASVGWSFRRSGQ